METLGSILKDAEEQVGKGKLYEHDFSTCKSYPQPTGEPLDVLRKSLERVVKKAKHDFIDCVYQSKEGDKIHAIASFVPQTEACYALLSGDNHRFDFDDKEFRTMFDEIWLEFLDWMKKEGLLLWIGPYRNNLGVRNFVLLQAFVRTEATLASARKKIETNKPLVKLFVD